MSIRKNKFGKKEKAVMLYMPLELHNELKKVVQEEEVSYKDLICKAISLYITQK